MRKSLLGLLASLCIFCNTELKIEVFFAPQDRPAKKLIETLNGANQRIFAAIYTLTDKKIASALLEAKKRGVDVQVILDKFSLESPWSKAALLNESGISVMLRSAQVPGPETLQTSNTKPETTPAPEEEKLRNFDGLEEAAETLQPEVEAVPEPVSKKLRNFNRDALMHNKYAIIDNLVWTGSLNWTVAANSRNQENCLLISGESEVVDKYLHNFEELKQKSTRLEKNMITAMQKEPPRSWKLKQPPLSIPPLSPAQQNSQPPASA